MDHLNELIFSTNFCHFYVGITLLFTILDFYLDIRQLRAIKSCNEVPIVLSNLVEAIETQIEENSNDSEDEEEDNESGDEDKKLSEPLSKRLDSILSKSRGYGVSKLSFGMFKSGLSTLINLVLLFNGFLPWLWSQSVQITLKMKDFGVLEEEGGDGSGGGLVNSVFSFINPENSWFVKFFYFFYFSLFNIFTSLPPPNP